uniref:Aquaporin n=1 Tax=Strigamia maritima TaxID=126957 RepID=T1IHK5_STRMM
MSLKTSKILGLKDLKRTPDLWKILISELLGTMLLVVFGCGASIPWTKSTDIVQIALAAGFTVATIVQITFHISGGHINPAMSLAMMVTGKMSIIMFVLYAICQCIGAIGGALLLKVLTPVHLRNNLGISTLNTDVSEVNGCCVEFLITFIMVITGFSVCDSNRSDVTGSVPLAIVCFMYFQLNFTGCSINPARSLGPAVIFNKWQHHWVYWAGPCSGAIVAGVLYQVVFKANRGSVSLISENKLNSLDI